jgi:taurine--2-oxoglutarate transaminase
MTPEEIVRLCKQHTMYTWTRGDAVDPLPIERTEGVWMVQPDGTRILDFNSQLMSVNIGHGDVRVLDAIKRQLDRFTYVYPGTATAVRARVGKLLSEVVPGDINTFFFTVSGAEANENAIKAARLYTGRHKIVSLLRSYHGATHACMQLTGDPRRWANEPGAPGFLRVMPPIPYDYSFGETDAERTANHLRYLDEVLMYEGPQTIAAMFIEPVIGTNGVLPHPEGWLRGLKDLLTKHGILLVCDEVMSGFGRTGKWFAFEHGGIVPDIVTMAKGLTSSYIPLGAMGVSDPIAEHFRTHVFWGGLTYNSHGVGLAAAEAVIGVMKEDNLVERAATMGAVMREEMVALQAKHPCVKEARNIGMFGMIDLQRNAAGDRMAPYNGTSPAMQELGAHFKRERLFTFVRWGSFMCNPPLSISRDEMRLGFAIIDRGLDLCDAHYEG